MDELARRRLVRLRFVIVAAGVALAGLAGFTGARSLPGAGDFSGGTLVLAAVAAFGAFFSPCSFPLLLTLLARPDSATVRRALRIGAGVAATFGVLAVTFVVGGLALHRAVRLESGAGQVFRGAVGSLLVVLGMHQMGRLRTDASWADRVACGAGSRVAGLPERAMGDFAYGAAYLLVGFG